MPLLPERFHPRGEAVAPNPEGRPARVRVFGGIPGEACEAVVTGAGAHEAHAVWIGAETPHADRVRPACPHYTRCGGCPWMHLAPEAAREWRRRLLADALAEAGAAVPVEPVRVGPDGDEGYRHVVRLVAADGPAGLRFGAYARGSHDIAYIPGCGALAPSLRPFTDLPPIAAPRGLVRHLVVRASRLEGRTLATLVVRADTPEAQRVARSIPADGVHLHVNDRPGDGILDPAGPTKRLAGRESLTEALGSARLELGPTDFFQTNPGVAGRMLDELPPVEGPLLDLYAGVGAIALHLAARDRCGPVLGVEESAAAVRRARANAKRMRLDVSFRCGRVGEAPVDGFAGATVVVDPPRSGLSDAARAQLATLAPRRVLYVACAPQALARDLPALIATGLRVERVVPYDMFPHTPHVEAVAWLERA